MIHMLMPVHACIYSNNALEDGAFDITCIYLVAHRWIKSRNGSFYYHHLFVHGLIGGPGTW